MFKQLVIAALLVASSAHAADFKLKAATSSRLGKMSLIHDGESFFVENESARKRIQPAYMSRELRNIKAHQLAALQRNGSLRVNRMQDGEYSLSAHARGNGGGPITGIICYGVAKIVGWSAVGATVSATMVAAAPALAATSVGSTMVTIVGGVAGSGAGSAVVGTVATNVISTVAAGAAGSALTASGGAAALAAGAQTAAAVVAMSGEAVAVAAAGAAAVTAGVEAFSTGAFYIGCAIPFLP